MRLSGRQKELVLKRFARLVHNQTYRVEVALQRGDETVMPGYAAAPTSESVIYHEFDDFVGSAYDIISGKLSRLFRNRVYLQAESFGLLDKASFLFQYIPNQYILQACSGNVTGVTPHATVLTDSGATFLTEPIRPDLDDGTIGASVTNVTDGSSGLVVSKTATTITVAELTGGELNLFSPGDEYVIYNINHLAEGDRAFIDNGWRQALAVVKDTEGIQHSVFMSSA
jgi:hypothetical protein